MAWVRIDEDFYLHPKVRRAGPLGMAMQVAALCYCNKYLTDGFVPRSVVPSLLNLEGIGMHVWHGELIGGGEDATWELVVQDLLEAGLWEEVDGGYQIHDYLDYQPSRAEVLAEREAAKERMARARAKRSQEVREKFARTSDEVPETCAGSSDNPVPDPVPDPDRDRNTCLSPSETGTLRVPAAEQAQAETAATEERITNRDLIAELTAEYRSIEGVEPQKGDFAFIGALYNEYGYDRVLCALNRLRQAMAVQPLQRPLVYLKGILRREEERGGDRRDTGAGPPEDRGAAGATRSPSAGKDYWSGILGRRAANRVPAPAGDDARGPPQPADPS